MDSLTIEVGFNRIILYIKSFWQGDFESVEEKWDCKVRDSLDQMSETTPFRNLYRGRKNMSKSVPTILLHGDINSNDLYTNCSSFFSWKIQTNEGKAIL